MNWKYLTIRQLIFFSIYPDGFSPISNYNLKWNLRFRDRIQIRAPWILHRKFVSSIHIVIIGIPFKFADWTSMESKSSRKELNKVKWNQTTALFDEGNIYFYWRLSSKLISLLIILDYLLNILAFYENPTNIIWIIVFFSCFPFFLTLKWTKREYEKWKHILLSVYNVYS